MKSVLELTGPTVTASVPDVLHTWKLRHPVRLTTTLSNAIRLRAQSNAVTTTSPVVIVCIPCVRVERMRWITATSDVAMQP